MDADRKRWNERYAGEGYLMGERPAPFLEEQLERLLALCPGRLALDIACGEGRNSVFLARHGFRVTALDISENALAKGARLAAAAGVAVDFCQADLEGYTIDCCYDLILNINFLLRDLLPSLVAALTPGGILLVDTLLAVPGTFSPHRPEHLLQPGELALLFAPYAGTILLAEEQPAVGVPTARLLFQSAGGPAVPA
ncbi:MAG TPA: methyltransferase domain-containing protein [Geobacteraceae bacterium]